MLNARILSLSKELVKYSSHCICGCKIQHVQKKNPQVITYKSHKLPKFYPFFFLDYICELHDESGKFCDKEVLVAPV